MMTKDCVSADRIDELLQLPKGSPEREHVESCPRCGALLMTYREFLEDRSVPAGADLEDAGRQLHRAFLDASRDSGRRERPVAQTRPPWLSNLHRAFRGKWILAPASLVLALGIYIGFEHSGREQDVDRLRGLAPPHPGRPADRVIHLGSSAGSVGSTELRWRAVAGATTYEVVVFGADLTDLARMQVGADTTCVLHRSDLRPEPTAGAVLGWQVIARRGDEVIGRSAVATVLIP